MFGVWINVVLLYINIELNNIVEKGMAANIKKYNWKNNRYTNQRAQHSQKKVT